MTGETKPVSGLDDGNAVSDMRPGRAPTGKENKGGKSRTDHVDPKSTSKKGMKDGY